MFSVKQSITYNIKLPGITNLENFLTFYHNSPTQKKNFELNK